MRHSTIGGALAIMVMAGIPAHAAMNTDPDWPCIQRKVPELSLGQIWTGADLPATANEWTSEDSVVDVIEEVAARRVPLEEAQAKIRAFADTLSEADKADRMTKLVRGLFDKMNAERSHVISGIARYAHRQLEMATLLRKESSEVDALRAKPDADQNELAIRTERLTWETRIFDERVQSLTYVCEVPTLIEQRLYQLVKIAGEAMPAK